MTDTDRYPPDVLDKYYEDDGTMPENVAALAEAVVGHRIVAAGYEQVETEWYGQQRSFVLTLDDGRRVRLRDTSDCCAYTELQSFLFNVDKVDHMILGVGTTDGYNTWHIYADFGDIVEMHVGWSPGNPFYYGYGFSIDVVDAS